MSNSEMTSKARESCLSIVSIHRSTRFNKYSGCHGDLVPRQIWYPLVPNQGRFGTPEGTILPRELSVTALSYPRRFGTPPILLHKNTKNGFLRLVISTKHETGA